MAKETGLENNVYTNERIGWQITIPQGWRVTQSEDIKSFAESGKKDIEAAHQQKVEFPPYEVILNFKKDLLNQFVTTLQKIDTESVGSHKEYAKQNQNIMAKTFAHKKYNFDKRSFEKTIGEVEFSAFEFILYESAKKEKVLLYQSLLFGQIGDQLMVVNANAKTRANYNELLKAFYNSRLNPPR